MVRNYHDLLLCRFFLGLLEGIVAMWFGRSPRLTIQQGAYFLALYSICPFSTLDNDSNGGTSLITSASREY